MALKIQAMLSKRMAWLTSRDRLSSNPTTAAREQMMISSMFASLQASAADVTADKNFATAMELIVAVGKLIAVTSSFAN